MLFLSTLSFFVNIIQSDCLLSYYQNYSIFPHFHQFFLEYCNPRVGYPYPHLSTGMKLTSMGGRETGTGRVRV